MYEFLTFGLFAFFSTLGFLYLITKYENARMWSKLKAYDNLSQSDYGVLFNILTKKAPVKFCVDIFIDC